MTLKELDRVFDLRAAKGAAELQRSALEKAAGDGNMFAEEIALIDERINLIQHQILEEETAILDFIHGIKDVQLAIAFRLRFIRGLLWKELYDLAGYPSKAAVTSAVYRYLKHQEKEKVSSSG